MSTRQSATAPGLVDAFIDPETDEVLDTEACKTDAHGTDIVGADDDGFWWGTERACWKLEHSPFIVRVTGRSRSGRTFDAWFIGSDESAIRYARRWGETLHIESGESGRVYETS